MTRLLFSASLALTAIAPAAAATYSAKPIAPVGQARIIARDISWACGPEACAGSTENSRPLVLCQGLAKQAGRLQNFVVDGRALPALELDKCNAAAKNGQPTALARAN